MGQPAVGRIEPIGLRAEQVFGRGLPVDRLVGQRPDRRVDADRVGMVGPLGLLGERGARTVDETTEPLQRFRRANPTRPTGHEPTGHEWPDASGRRSDQPFPIGPLQQFLYI